MPMFPISPAGQYGLITDVPSHETPLNSWSNCQNMHFLEGSAEKVLGYRELFAGAPIAPYFLTTVRPVTGTAFWVYAGATAVYAFDSSHNNITRASGAYTSANWQGDVMNGLLYLNNGVDKPQIWSPAVNTQLLIDLPNWPATTRAAVIRNFKNFMIALDVTKVAVRDSRLVKWSHPASAGSYPSSWDETDPTKDAGEYSMAETEGQLLDCMPLRDINVIYKDDSIWGMSFVGGLDIFRFFNLFRNVGAISKNCMKEFTTGQHIVFARDDVYVHDGQNIQAVIRGKLRRRIYDNIDNTNIMNSYLAVDTANTEVWICFPETGHTYPSLALVWNWKSNTTGFRDLPDAVAISRGIADATAGSDAWSSDSLPWSSDSSGWGQTMANPSQTRLVMALPGTSKFQGLLPDTNDADGVAFTASLEKTGIGIPFKEGQPPDFSSMKFFRGIWPKITGTTGGVVQIRMGVHNDFNIAPTWGAWQDYTIGTTTKIDYRGSGRLGAVAFRSTTAISWKLQGYSLDVEYAGNY